MLTLSIISLIFFTSFIASVSLIDKRLAGSDIDLRAYPYFHIKVGKLLLIRDERTIASSSATAKTMLLPLLFTLSSPISS